MYLKKLELLGFKSFADRTELSFKPGMTGIVGPNGCGKSNVVDAFKWIFGEQSAKGMRGSEMKDVIFNGTQKRKPSGYAEVTIVFENEDRYLDVDYAEVAITRRLYRSGESEYLINKQRCRLKDIKGLFIGTGMGRTSYSIFEQGKIDVFLQANELDRRIVLEEAAGVSKYRVKREETIRSLLRVEDNLTRLNDIIEEVEKRIARLKAQASKARRYRRISQRLKELRVRSAIEDYRDSVVASADTEFRLYYGNYRLRLIEKLIDELHGRLEARKSERLANQGHLRELRERLETERMRRERTRERIQNGERRERELIEEEESKREELENTGAAIERLRVDVEKESAELEQMRAAVETCREELDGLTATRDAARGRAGELEASLQNTKDEMVSLIQQRSRVGNGIAQLEAERRNLAARSERLATNLDGFRRTLAAEDAREREEQADAEKQRQELERLTASVGGLETAVAGLEAGVRDVESEVAANRKELHQCVSRREVLESLERKLEGVRRGVVEILRRAEGEHGEDSPLAQIHGMLASLVQVETRYARAVESVLGRQTQALVVEDQDGGLGLIDMARSERLGSLEVVCLDRVAPIESEHFPRHGGVLGALRDYVRVKPGLEDVVDRLLVNVVLVEDLPTAVALSRNGLRAFRLVTLAGEIVEPWGGLALPGDSDVGVISRRSELDDLAHRVRALEETDRELEAVLEARRADLAARRREVEAAREERASASRRLVEIEGVIAQTVREIDRLNREIGVGTSEANELAQEIASRKAQGEDLEREARELDARQQACEQQIAALQSQFNDAVGEVEEAENAVQQKRLQLVEAEKSVDALVDILRRQEGNLTERETHLHALGRRLEALAERQVQAAKDLRLSREELEHVLEREQGLRQVLEVEEEADRELESHEGAIEQEIGNLQRESQRGRDERESAQLRAQEEKHRRNTLVERMDEEYGIHLVQLMDASPPAAVEDESPARTEDAEPSTREETGETEKTGSLAEEYDGVVDERAYLIADPEWNREAARAEAKELQEKLRRIGSVNLEALDELDELQQRNRFQLEQRADLEESERKLRSIITELNRTCKELFLETFEQVQRNFSELFRKCFGGGKAELVLQEGVDVLDAGIEIVARPPGKKISSLSLMSGGEKTMTTLALLFAIARTRPSPFCILDEVDAPLDEPNVRRFGVLLQEFIDQSQFIVVTHNKITMANADTLYGVTMQEHGVSTRVSVELDNYDPARLESEELGV